MSRRSPSSWPSSRDGSRSSRLTVSSSAATPRSCEHRASAAAAGRAGRRRSSSSLARVPADERRERQPADPRRCGAAAPAPRAGSSQSLPAAVRNTLDVVRCTDGTPAASSAAWTRSSCAFVCDHHGDVAGPDRARRPAVARREHGPPSSSVDDVVRRGRRRPSPRAAADRRRPPCPQRRASCTGARAVVQRPARVRGRHRRDTIRGSPSAAPPNILSSPRSSSGSLRQFCASVPAGRRSRRRPGRRARRRRGTRRWPASGRRSGPGWRAPWKAQPQDVPLHRVGVLELVDEHDPVALPQPLRGGRPTRRSASVCCSRVSRSSKLSR